MKLITVLLSVFHNELIVFAWDLSVLKLSPTYYASDVGVYKNRAFLALPRSSCFNNVTNPTLVEVPWPNDNKYAVFRKKIYPSYRQQIYGDCKDHQDVVSLDVETKKAKLWVLDRGSKKCAPKIVIYNLYYNTIAQSSRLVDYKGVYLTHILVDTFGGRAFIGGLENTVLIYSTKTLKITKAVLDFNDQIVPTQYLSISKIKPIMYTTSDTNFEVFSINLNHLRHCEEFFNHQGNCKIDVGKLGEKLGPSTSILSDFKSGLYYYLIRDYAIVKWNEELPIIAENHEVLKQSYKKMPYVSNFVSDQPKIYALVNYGRYDKCFIDKEIKLKSRVIEI